MKRMLFFYYVFSLTFLSASNPDNLRCRLSKNDYSWHQHIIAVCNEYDLAAYDIDGNSPIISILKDRDPHMTRDIKAQVLGCMVCCGNCLITDNDRTIAKEIYLECLLPKTK